MWTGLTWVFMPLLASRYGYLGVAYATAIIATSSVVTIIMANQVIPLNLVKIIKNPILSSIIMALFLGLTLQISSSIPAVFIFGAASITVYLFSTLVLEGRQFFETTINYFKLKNV
jgi:hypothetical protein